MSSRFFKLSFVLVVFAALAASQACANRATVKERVEQGCCWKKKDSTVTCSAPVLKDDCPEGFKWVKDKSCSDKECGAA